MSQRRFHTKSRFGCLQCKQTRKKCDENRPKCGRCERIGQGCSLSDISSSLVFISSNPTTGRRRPSFDSAGSRPETESTASPTVSTALGINSSPEQMYSSPSFTSISDSSNTDSMFSDTERDRLRLMHHYTLHTATTLVEISVPRGKDPSVWEDFAIELAFESDLVLHGLLSLSALHLALRGISKRENTILAIHHHDLGLALFRPYLSNITDQNYDSVLAFNCIVMAYTFGIQRCSETTTNTIAKIHQVLTLIHDGKPITKSHMEMLRSSRWSALMLPEPYPSGEEKLSDEMESMLAKLIQCTPIAATTANQADAYMSAIQSLRYVLIFATVSKPPQISLVLFSALTPGQYWDMLKDGNPLALAILANYAVTLYWLRDNIWMEGWGKETINAVREALPPEWHDCISWAIRETTTGMDTS